MRTLVPSAILGAILVAVWLLLLDCSVRTATAAITPEPIKVGAVLPFSGGVEAYGRQAKMGLDLAAKEINAASGILGRPVKIIYEDDKTDPQAALAAVHKLIEQDGVLALVGPITSRNLNAIVPTIEATKTPLLYATNYEGGISSRYVFSFNTVPNQELAQLLPYVNQTCGNTHFLLGADRAWPHKMFDAAAPIISKLGGKIVGKEFTTGKETDFSALIKRIAAAKPNVLLFALKGDGLNFIPQAYDLGLFENTCVAFLGLSETDLPVFRGKDRNMFVVVPFVASSDLPSTKAFVAKVRAEAGADAIVSHYVVTHYDALLAMKAALEKAGKIDKEAMIDALEGLSIESPTGLVTIGKNHHATMNMFLAKAEGSNLLEVRALGEIAPEPGGNPAANSSNHFSYECSQPPLDVTFPVEGEHYSGAVQCGNLFLEPDIPNAPTVKWQRAETGKFYTLMMVDLDGNANGSWPDPVPPGTNAPVRHWIVGNIPGELLRTTGYVESAENKGPDKPRIIQAYRAPHIPVVSDRYGLYLFEQTGRHEFTDVSGPITNFDCAAFLRANKLGEPKASNFFVAVYTSKSPFSGKPFQGNDVSAIWQRDRGNGRLAPVQALPSSK